MSANDSSNILSNQMGRSFERLSPLIQRVHTGSQVLEGCIRVYRGNWLSEIICNIFRFPKANDRTLLRVECDHTKESMQWHRDFNGHEMKSHFILKDNSLVEKIGPLDLYFRPTEKNGELRYHFYSTNLFGIPLPSFFSPVIFAKEYERDSMYFFEVHVVMAFVGLILSYGGEMKLVT